MNSTSPRFSNPRGLLRSLFLWSVFIVTASLAGWWLGSWSNCQLKSWRPIVRHDHAATVTPAVASQEPVVEIMKDNEAWKFDRINAARELLESGTDEEVLEAIRSLGNLGGSASANILAVIAGDKAWPEDLRIEAIQALGSIHTSSSASALKALLGNVADVPLQMELVAALGIEPYFDIAQPFEKILTSESSAPELRVATAEALARSTPEALPTLKNLTAADADADVRAAAAWAMSCIRTDQSYGKELADIARKEPEIMVRRRIYEALLVQENNTAVALAPLIQKETDVAARVAGLNALGDAVSRSMSPKLATDFDARQVPELTQIALSNETTNLRMRAVFALRRASTPVAMQALTQIAKAADTPQVARAAYNGAKTTAF